MFSTSADGAIDHGDGKVLATEWEYVSVQGHQPWFYATEYCVGEYFFEEPTERVVLTTNLARLGKMLTGKNKRRSIKKIEVIAKSKAQSPLDPERMTGVVKRIIRLDNTRGKGERYFAETTLGFFFEGSHDCSWSTAKPCVVFDVYESLNESEKLDMAWVFESREIQRKVVFRLMDLFQGDLNSTSKMWRQKLDQLGGKAPSELTSEGDYVLFLDVVGAVHRN